MKQKKHIYRVEFISDGEIYQVYCKHVSDSGLFGFVELEELLFGENSSIVVDPSEERLQQEFADVQRTYVPMHNIIRIDVVHKEGVAKVIEFSDNKSNVRTFPDHIYKPKSSK